MVNYSCGPKLFSLSVFLILHRLCEEVSASLQCSNRMDFYSHFGISLDLFCYIQRPSFFGLLCEILWEYSEMKWSYLLFLLLYCLLLFWCWSFFTLPLICHPHCSHLLIADSNFRYKAEAFIQLKRLFLWSFQSKTLLKCFKD